MIEVLVPDGHGELMWAEMPMPIAARMVVGVARVQAVRLSGADYHHASQIFLSLPNLRPVPVEVGDERGTYPADGPVTWFGDHARFIVANWR